MSVDQNLIGEGEDTAREHLHLGLGQHLECLHGGLLRSSMLLGSRVGQIGGEIPLVLLSCRQLENSIVLLSGIVCRVRRLTELMRRMRPRAMLLAAMMERALLAQAQSAGPLAAVMARRGAYCAALRWYNGRMLEERSALATLGQLWQRQGSNSLRELQPLIMYLVLACT